MGNDEFMHPEVKAVNIFRQEMKGQKEDIQIGNDGQVLVVNRGKKGAAIINLSTLAQKIDIKTGLPSGTYKDVVYGKEFKVKNGKIIGYLAPERTYILVK